MAVTEADIRRVVDAVQSIAKTLEQAKGAIDACSAEIRALAEVLRERQAGQHDLFSGCGRARDITEGG
jgi:bacterioferritin-associated ferredoxin